MWDCSRMLEVCQFSGISLHNSCWGTHSRRTLSTYGRSMSHRTLHPIGDMWNRGPGRRAASQVEGARRLCWCLSHKQTKRNVQCKMCWERPLYLDKQTYVPCRSLWQHIAQDVICSIAMCHEWPCVDQNEHLMKPLQEHTDKLQTPPLWTWLRAFSMFPPRNSVRLSTCFRGAAWAS